MTTEAENAKIAELSKRSGEVVARLEAVADLVTKSEWARIEEAETKAARASERMRTDESEKTLSELLTAFGALLDVVEKIAEAYGELLQ